MEFIGKHLKSKRTEKKISLKKISKELMISENLLKDIESDDFPKYLSTVYLIGHIRSYSKFLNLDDNLVVENFKIQVSYNRINVSKEISKPIKSINTFSYSGIMSFASIIIILIGTYFIFIQPNDLQPQYAMTPDVPENLQYSLEKTEMNLFLNKNTNQNITQNQFYKEEDNLNDINNDIKKIASSSVNASIPEIKNIDNEEVKITLKIINATWIQLRDDEQKIILSQLMNKGDEYSYNLSDSLNLTAGNAGNIIVVLNGEVKGRAGKVGEVIESLIIDNSFKN